MLEVKHKFYCSVLSGTLQLYFVRHCSFVHLLNAGLLVGSMRNELRLNEPIEEGT